MKITKVKISYHRNGISGDGFHAILFTWRDDKILRNMVASVFENSGRLAVYDVDQLKAGNIAFAHGNSWRGDDFEPALRVAIKDADDEADRLYAIRISTVKQITQLEAT